MAPPTRILYMSDSTRVTVDSKFGVITIVVNGPDTLYTYAGEPDTYETRDTRKYTVTVRNVPIRCNVHLKDYKDGKGYVPTKNNYGQDYTAFYGSISDGRIKDQVSDSARRAIMDEFARVANEWIKANPLEPLRALVRMKETANAAIVNDVKDTQAKLVKLDNDLIDADQELQAARLALHDAE